MKRQKHPHLLGSKWTAKEKTFGWRHFQVVSRKNEASTVFAEMVAACDPAVSFWINAQSLKDRQRWQPGWKSLAEQERAVPEAKISETKRSEMQGLNAGQDAPDSSNPGKMRENLPQPSAPVPSIM